jgi:hypothetical protein
MPLQFARGVMKDAQIGEKTLRVTANYGINLMEISNLHPETDSSCAPITPECLLRG